MYTVVREAMGPRRAPGTGDRLARGRSWAGTRSNRAATAGASATATPTAAPAQQPQRPTPPPSAWQPSATDVEARFDASTRRWSIDDEARFSWMWCPLIAHALGQGALFPAFPIADPFYAESVQQVALALALLDEAPVEWAAIVDVPGTDHVSAAFQERVQAAMKANDHIDAVNDINMRAVTLAQATCAAANA